MVGMPDLILSFSFSALRISACFTSSVSRLELDFSMLSIFPFGAREFYNESIGVSGFKHRLLFLLRFAVGAYVNLYAFPISVFMGHGSPTRISLCTRAFVWSLSG